MSLSSTYGGAAQLERTILSWNRSGVAVVLNGSLVAREGFLHDVSPVAVMGFGIIGVGGVLWLVSTGRYRNAFERPLSDLLAGDRRVVRLWTLFVILLSLVDLALALLPE